MLYSKITLVDFCLIFLLELVSEHFLIYFFLSYHTISVSFYENFILKDNINYIKMKVKLYQVVQY